ncbi:ATP-binding protein [Lichenihabitans psoromatis]|uniref:ATP-binding protein n=1 Tax=Lichenihabitans psoromatis TaxID=2528642 RepID=UPI00315C747E
MMLDHPPLTSDRSLLSALIAALPGPVIVVTADMRIIAANGPALDILPVVRPGDLLALSLRDPDVLDGVNRVHASGLAETVAWRDRVPVERSYEVTIAPLDAPEEERLIVLTIRDLTETHRVERMRVDFVANASHELRTPLASLLGFVETLQGPARDDAKARERFLAIMGEQARRMARLVDDLLSLSRIEQNLHLKPNKPVDLGSVVRHVVDTLAPLAQENGARVEVESSEPVIVSGDRDELVRVAENLIENAIKYGGLPRPRDGAAAAPASCHVEISIVIHRRVGVLTVRDHGPGIAPEHLPRLTERFYRVDAGQSRAKGGTGLGLAIVKHIVARHRGRMTVESEVGQGCVFTASIPLYPQPTR